MFADPGSGAVLCGADGVCEGCRRRRHRRGGAQEEEGEEEDIDVPALEPKKEKSILNGVKSLFTKPRAIEQDTESKHDDVINRPTRTGYTAKPSYFKSPEHTVQQ